MDGNGKLNGIGMPVLKFKIRPLMDGNHNNLSVLFISFVF